MQRFGPQEWSVDEEKLSSLLFRFLIPDQYNFITLLQRNRFSVLCDDADLVVAEMPALPTFHETFDG